MVARCVATTKQGTPCKGPAQRGRAYCLSHDPARADQLAAARRKGGEGKAAKKRAMRDLADRALTPEEFAGLIGAVALAVFAGGKSPAIGNAIANLSKAATAIAEATTIQERLAALEATAGMDRRNA